MDEANSVWTVATAEREGMPVIFRIRTGLPEFAERERFPSMIIVAWSFESDNDSGMPEAEVNEQMAELEDLLIEALEAQQQAFLCVVITTGGTREWMWYSSDPEKTMELVNEALGESDPLPIEFGVEEDPEWESYLGFIEILDGAKEPEEGGEA